MIKIILFVIFNIFIFTGCGANGGLEILELNEPKYSFKKGEIISSNKIIVSKDKLAITNGALLGTGTGVAVGSFGGVPIQGALVGGGIGAVGGYFTGLAIDGNETEVYEVVIRQLSDLKEYKAFVHIEIPTETRVEFVLRENNIVTNIRIE